MQISANAKGKTGAIVFLWLSLLLTCTGCHSAARPSVGGPTPGDDQMISVTELAHLLGLRIYDTASTHITLKNGANTLLIFTFDGGQFYVNGKLGGPVGPTEQDGSDLLVERSLVTRIRPHLSLKEPGVTAPTQDTPRRGLIVIDPGHGGKDPGAVSTLGYYEKEVNLAVAKYLDTLLNDRGFKTMLTRHSDDYVSLDERADRANRQGADLFVSIHADSVDSSSPNGFSVYTARLPSSRATQLAQAIVQDLASTGIRTRGVHKANYQVLIKTECPSVLIEMGFLSNPWDAQRLHTPDTQHRIAQAIAAGIERFADQHRI